MTDLVEQLRAYGGDEMLHQSAADEIARLRAELARIRGLPRLAALDDEIERLREENKFLRSLVADKLRALEPKP